VSAPVPLPRDAVPQADWQALAERAVIVRRRDAAVLDFTGPGRVDCLQGLVSCDVVTPGDGASLYGGLLTSKGMIVAPVWIARLAERLVVELPLAARTVVLDLLARSLPPRLCRAQDLTDTHAQLGLHGPGAADLLARVLGQAPPEGAALGTFAGTELVVAAARARGMPGWELTAPLSAAEPLSQALRDAGAHPASAALSEACRIEAGLPALGAEIDERTLPQEVRGDELGMVSYTKGCYVGQETVARLHFRGHANRRLVGVALSRAPALLPAALSQGDREVGRLASAVWSAALGGWIGTGIVRHDLADGAQVTVAGGDDGVVRLDRWLRAP
jgi:folate-binding protein YgfZ